MLFLVWAVEGQTGLLFGYNSICYTHFSKKGYSDESYALDFINRGSFTNGRAAKIISGHASVENMYIHISYTQLSPLNN